MLRIVGLRVCIERPALLEQRSIPLATVAVVWWSLRFTRGGYSVLGATTVPGAGAVSGATAATNLAYGTGATAMQVVGPA
jgi:hypothetical protein